jgi:hypothetical protein
MLAEVGNRGMFPLEKPMTVAEFHSNGGTPLKAIKRLCLDCSGHSKAAVRTCQFAACELHPYRNGKNPNRRMGPEQRAIASERLKAKHHVREGCRVRTNAGKGLGPRDSP